MTPLCDTHLIEPLANQGRSEIGSCTLETTTTHIPGSAQRRPVGTFKFRGDRREWRPSRRRWRSARNTMTREGNLFGAEHSTGSIHHILRLPRARWWCTSRPMPSHFTLGMHQRLEIHRTGEPTCNSSLTSASETTVGAMPFLFPDFTSNIHRGFNLDSLPLPSHSRSKTSERSEYLLKTAWR